MNNLFDDEEIDIVQDKCFHCGATVDEGAILREAHCSHGQGLLHCEECSDTCGGCFQIICDWEMRSVYCGETYGMVKLCGDCEKELGNESR